MTILVTGATGKVGASVVRELDRRGQHVRALVRDPARARGQLGPRVELAVGDFGDPASVRAALEGVERLFLSSGDGPAKVGHETTVIDAAAAAGVRLVVKLSVIGAEAGSALPGMDWNGRIEDHLRASGVPAVMLRSGFFMATRPDPAGATSLPWALTCSADASRLAMIDPRDVGAAGAAALTTAGQDGAVHDLTGPEALDYERIAATLAAVTGRPVAYMDVPEEAARDAMVRAGLPGWLVTHLVGAFRLIRADAFAWTSDAVQALTGRPPRSLAEFLGDHAAAFGAGAPASAGAPAAPAG